ncbi:MAG: hypothetical protein V2I54_06710, partial [Bacteroidales bacterium]|nr:hypothetical protein [Bacteroidales bacterium]
FEYGGNLLGGKSFSFHNYSLKLTIFCLLLNCPVFGEAYNDFEKLHYRLFFALHFVTANYIVEYHKINP